MVARSVCSCHSDESECSFCGLCLALRDFLRPFLLNIERLGSLWVIRGKSKKRKERNGMTKKVKIITAGLNLVCLVAALSMPDSTTPFVLLMTIISTAAWAFVNPEGEDIKNTGVYFHVFLAVLAGAICILLGVTSKIVALDSAGQTVYDTTQQVVSKYVFQFNNKVIFFAGDTWDYNIFVVGMFALVAFLTLGDIVNTFPPDDKNRVYSQSVASYINKKIQHIR